MKVNLSKGEWFQIGLAALSVIGIGASTASSIVSSRIGEKTVGDIKNATESAVQEIREAYAETETETRS